MADVIQFQRKEKQTPKVERKSYVCVGCASDDPDDLTGALFRIFSDGSIVCNDCWEAKNTAHAVFSPDLVP